MATQALPFVQTRPSGPHMGALLGGLLIRGIGLGLAGAGVILSAVMASFLLA